MPPLHWVAATLTFVMVRLSPSDPAVIRLGGMATPEELAAERERLGLNDPVLVPYGRYMTGILRLDFGPSLIRGGPAMAQVLDRVPNSLLLGASAMVIVIGVSIPLGLLAGRHGGRVPDHLITGGSLVGQALPEFWVGLMLMLVFARQLHWLPSSGMGSLWHLLMPAFTLALPLSSVMVRLVRGGMIGVLRED